MREIKFKAKRIDNGEWAEGYYYCFSGRHYIHVIEPWPGGASLACYEVNPATVCQFVSGEGFFEGDILFGQETNEYGTPIISWTGIVKYDEDAGRVRILDISGDWYETDDYIYEKVIGNIHDNPELAGDMPW